MTGFGVGEAILADIKDAAARADKTPARGSRGSAEGGTRDKVAVDIRAVNHRFLDVRVRVPSQVPDLAGVVESLARERLSRGRFDVSVRLEGSVLGAMVVDRDRAVAGAAHGDDVEYRIFVRRIRHDRLPSSKDARPADPANDASMKY